MNSPVCLSLCRFEKPEEEYCMHWSSSLEKSEAAIGAPAVL